MKRGSGGNFNNSILQHFSGIDSAVKKYDAKVCINKIVKSTTTTPFLADIKLFVHVWSLGIFATILKLGLNNEKEGRPSHSTGYVIPCREMNRNLNDNQWCLCEILDFLKDFIQ